ncbi:hypothetical protein OIO90_001515 [Microbotryomycetes sp. JL221]|nr:hypothetical protein OIO90_001515 [Microbotryomycetes sp. JL221]
MRLVLVHSESEQEDACEVRWTTKSVFDLEANPALRAPPPTTAANGSTSGIAVTTTPHKQAATSATSNNGKRGTNVANLPSPSASTTSSKPMRVRKLRRSSARPGSSSGHSVTTTEPRADSLDAHTLKLVAELAKRLNDKDKQQKQQQSTPRQPLALRSKSVNVDQATTPASTESKDVQLKRTSKPSHLTATHLPTPTSLPRGRTRNHQPAAPSGLALGTASKPSLNDHSTSSTSIGAPRAKSIASATSSTTVKSTTTAATTALRERDTMDEFDAMLNDDGDNSFELALTQFDVQQAMSGSSQPTKPTNTTLPVVKTSTKMARASPRLASKTVKTSLSTMSAQVRAKLVEASTKSSSKAKVQTTTTLKQSHQPKSTTLVTPQSGNDMFSRTNTTVVSAPSLGTRAPLARTSSRTELPQAEAEQLCAGFDSWSDVDDF